MNHCSRILIRRQFASVQTGPTARDPLAAIHTKVTLMLTKTATRQALDGSHTVAWDASKAEVGAELAQSHGGSTPNQTDWTNKMKLHLNTHSLLAFTSPSLVTKKLRAE